MRKQNIVSLILSLLAPCCPATILWGVITIIVTAIKRTIWIWSRPHISIEVLKRCQPASANRNASPAPSGIISIVGICASLFHYSPCVVFGCIGKAVRSYGVTNQAPTRTLPAKAKFCAGCHTMVTTITLAVPRSIPFPISSTFQYYQSAISIPGFVNYWSAHIILQRAKTAWRGSSLLRTRRSEAVYC